MVGVSTFAALAGVASLHLVWASGNPWPFPNQSEFAEKLVGGDHFQRLEPAPLSLPGRGSDFGRSTQHPEATIHRGATAIVMGLRGAAGLVAYRHLAAGAPRVAQLELGLYSPPCLLSTVGSITAGKIASTNAWQGRARSLGRCTNYRTPLGDTQSGGASF